MIFGNRKVDEPASEIKPTLKSGVDLIISWPKSMDYPVWRAFILKHYELFGKIFIVFTETNTDPDYSKFVEMALDKENFVFIYPGPLEPGQDWRDQAVNLALEKSTANWVWFTEQDFMVLTPAFWAIVSLAMTRSDAIGYKEGQRLHPANLWVKREFINKTKKFFGVIPDKLDHFGRFYTELRLSGATIHQMKYEGGNNVHDTFYHMNGLSSNLSLIQRGELPNYKEDEFADYLKLSLQVNPMDFTYRRMVIDYLKEYHERKEAESSS